MAIILSVAAFAPDGRTLAAVMGNSDAATIAGAAVDASNGVSLWRTV
jgi:hypothetical protein